MVPWSAATRARAGVDREQERGGEDHDGDAGLGLDRWQ